MTGKAPIDENVEFLKVSADEIKAGDRFNHDGRRWRCTTNARILPMIIPGKPPKAYLHMVAVGERMIKGKDSVVVFTPPHDQMIEVERKRKP